MRILFVDDEPNVLAGLRRLLHGMRDRWSMEFAPGGAEAIAAFEQAPFDVVVSDMRMPGMDGATLLGRIRDRWPMSIRIILSGNVEQASLLKCIETAHQYLSKPCDPERLKSAISRASRLREILTDTALAERLARVDAIPSLPDVYLRMVEKVNDASASARDIGDVIAADMGMSARILQIVNSAFFGQPRHVATPGDAAVLLGLDVLRSLVLSTHVFRSAPPEAAAACRLHDLQHHSHMVGVLARRFAARIGMEQQQQDEAFLAGTLHDVGHLMLAQLDPIRVARFVDRAADACGLALDDERAELGTDHARAGAFLLGAWGLPRSIVEAVAFHHEPPTDLGPGPTAFTCVHVAEAVIGSAVHTDFRCTPGLDLGYLENLGLTDEATEFARDAKATMPADRHG